MPKLRPFQQQAKGEIYDAWRVGHKVVAAVMPTGSGKTVLFSDIVAEYQSASVAIAHRSELVSQMSLALARNSVRHRIIGPKSLAKACTSLHMLELQRNFVDPGARVAAAGVDTLVRRDTSHDSWFRQVGLVVQDECHHMLRDNKWGQAFDMFPNAFGLGVTATPTRADGKGLGRDADGLIDYMVEGPSMRELINAGYLTDYRVRAPQGTIDYDAIPIGAGGEISMPKLRDAVHHDKRIVGDVVGTYQQFDGGKLGVTFAVDVEEAGKLAAAYKSAGVSAEVVTAKTPDGLRFAILRKFRNREVKQLVNVDLFGEGFDLPALETVSMARRTESYALYCQQFGRALRLMIDPLIAAHWDEYTAAQRLAFIAASEKPFACVNDHVGNIIRHGLPDRIRIWSLDRRERGTRGQGADDAIPLRSCVQCLGVYERFYRSCPQCGFIPAVIGRGTPEQVDGVMLDIDPLILAKLRGEMAHAGNINPTVPFSAPAGIQGEVIRKHGERYIAQQTLRGLMALWGGAHDREGRSQAEQYSRFYFKFKIDALTAQTLPKREAEDLIARVTDDLSHMGVL